MDLNSVETEIINLRKTLKNLIKRFNVAIKSHDYKLSNDLKLDIQRTMQHIEAKEIRAKELHSRECLN